MGEREQLVADIRAALPEILRHRATQNAIVRSYGIMPSSRPEDDDLDREAADAIEALTAALAVLEPEEPAQPEQCPTCGTTNADGWVQVQYDSGEWSRELEPCPDPWHFGGEQ